MIHANTYNLLCWERWKYLKMEILQTGKYLVKWLKEWGGDGPSDSPENIIVAMMHTNRFGESKILKNVICLLQE